MLFKKSFFFVRCHTWTCNILIAQENKGVAYKLLCFRCVRQHFNGYVYMYDSPRLVINCCVSAMHDNLYVVTVFVCVPLSPTNESLLCAVAEDTMEGVLHVTSGLRHHRGQLLSQLEFLPPHHEPTEILQGRPAV